MAKYCLSCGAAVEVGTNICKRCGQAVGVMNRQQNIKQVRGMSGTYLRRYFIIFFGLLKRPVENGKKFVASGETKLCITFFVVQAVLSAIFVSILLKSINSLSSVIGLARNILPFSGDNSEVYLFSYEKGFLITIIGSMVVSFAVVGILYVIALVFGGKMTFERVIRVVAVRSVGVDILLALSIVVAYLNMSYGIVAFCFSWLMGLVFMIPVIGTGTAVNTNRVPYIAIITVILLFVVFYLWIKVSLPWYFPSALKENVEQILEQLGNLNSLGNLF